MENEVGDFVVNNILPCSFCTSDLSLRFDENASDTLWILVLAFTQPQSRQSKQIPFQMRSPPLLLLTLKLKNATRRLLHHQPWTSKSPFTNF